MESVVLLGGQYRWCDQKQKQGFRLRDVSGFRLRLSVPLGTLRIEEC